MTADVAEIAALVAASGPRAGETRIVAIDGPAGAGKTELAGRLSRELAGAPVVHMDWLYPGWEGLEQGVGRLERELLEPLATTGSATVIAWDWVESRPGEPQSVGPAGTVIVEGVGSGASSGTEFISLLIWVDADREERRRRAIARDGESFALHWDEWAAQEDSHYARERTVERADLRIRTDRGDQRSTKT